MNDADIIESGLLERFVLGECTPAEEAIVLRAIGESEAIRAELAVIEQANEQLAFNSALQPRELVKARLMASIAEGSTSPKATPVFDIAPQHDALRSPSFWRIAATVLLFISAGINVWLFTELNSATNRLAQIENENAVLAAELTVQRDRSNALFADLQTVVQPGVKTIELRGNEKQPNALALLYWNEDNNELYLSANQLEALPEDKQYQLWALVDGTPVDAGVFELIDGVLALQRMKSIETDAAAFAITVEPRGGRPTPTLETLCLYGETV